MINTDQKNKKEHDIGLLSGTQLRVTLIFLNFYLKKFRKLKIKVGKGRLQNKKHDSFFFSMAELIIAVSTRECFDEKRSIT